MGNTVVIPSFHDWYTQPLKKQKITINSHLDAGQFFLVFDGKNSQNQDIIIKAYVYNQPLQNLEIIKQSEKYFQTLSEHATEMCGIINFNYIIQENMVFLFRPKFQKSFNFAEFCLYQQPVLEPIEKLFIFYQIYITIKKLHEIGLAHGDLKPSNIFINGHDLDLCIVDPAPFKPNHIQQSRLHVFYHYFRTSSDSGCYLAPERISGIRQTQKSSNKKKLQTDEQNKNHAKNDDDSTNSEEDDGYNSYENDYIDEENNDTSQIDLKIADIFSFGCIIAFLYLDGEHLFDLSKLQKYANGKLDVRKELAPIKDENIINIIMGLISMDIDERQETMDKLDELFDNFFAVFSKLFYEYRNDESFTLRPQEQIPKFKKIVHDHFENGRLLVFNFFFDQLLKMKNVQNIIYCVEEITKFVNYIEPEQNIDKEQKSLLRISSESAFHSIEFPENGGISSTIKLARVIPLFLATIQKNIQSPLIFRQCSLAILDVIKTVDQIPPSLEGYIENYLKVEFDKCVIKNRTKNILVGLASIAPYYLYRLKRFLPEESLMVISSSFSTIFGQDCSTYVFSAFSHSMISVAHMINTNNQNILKKEKDIKTIIKDEKTKHKESKVHTIKSKEKDEKHKEKHKDKEKTKEEEKHKDKEEKHKDKEEKHKDKEEKHKDKEEKHKDKEEKHKDKEEKHKDKEDDKDKDDYLEKHKHKDNDDEVHKDTEEEEQKEKLKEKHKEKSRHKDKDESEEKEKKHKEKEGKKHKDKDADDANGKDEMKDKDSDKDEKDHQEKNEKKHKDKEGKKHKDKDKDKDKDSEKDEKKHKDKESKKHKDKDSGKDKDKEKDKNKDKDKEKGKDKDSEKNKDKSKDKDAEKHKEKHKSKDDHSDKSKDKKKDKDAKSHKSKKAKDGTKSPADVFDSFENQYDLIYSDDDSDDDTSSFDECYPTIDYNTHSLDSGYGVLNPFFFYILSVYNNPDIYYKKEALKIILEFYKCSTHNSEDRKKYHQIFSESLIPILMHILSREIVFIREGAGTGDSNDLREEEYQLATSIFTFLASLCEPIEKVYSMSEVPLDQVKLFPYSVGYQFYSIALEYLTKSNDSAVEHCVFRFMKTLSSQIKDFAFFKSFLNDTKRPSRLSNGPSYTSLARRISFTYDGEYWSSRNTTTVQKVRQTQLMPTDNYEIENPRNKKQLFSPRFIASFHSESIPITHVLCTPSVCVVIDKSNRVRWISIPRIYEKIKEEKSVDLNLNFLFHNERFVNNTKQFAQIRSRMLREKVTAATMMPKFTTSDESSSFFLGYENGAIDQHDLSTSQKTRIFDGLNRVSLTSRGSRNSSFNTASVSQMATNTSPLNSTLMSISTLNSNSFNLAASTFSMADEIADSAVVAIKPISENCIVFANKQGTVRMIDTRTMDVSLSLAYDPELGGIADICSWSGIMVGVGFSAGAVSMIDTRMFQPFSFNALQRGSLTKMIPMNSRSDQLSTQLGNKSKSLFSSSSILVLNDDDGQIAEVYRQPLNKVVLTYNCRENEFDKDHKIRTAIPLAGGAIAIDDISASFITMNTQFDKFSNKYDTYQSRRIYESWVTPLEIDGCDDTDAANAQRNLSIHVPIKDQHKMSSIHMHSGKITCATSYYDSNNNNVSVISCDNLGFVNLWNVISRK